MKYSTMKAINKHLTVTHQRRGEPYSTWLLRPQAIDVILGRLIIECLNSRHVKTTATCSPIPKMRAVHRFLSDPLDGLKPARSKLPRPEKLNNEGKSATTPREK
jgi:hypothetical protein